MHRVMNIEGRFFFPDGGLQHSYGMELCICTEITNRTEATSNYSFYNQSILNEVMHHEFIS
jgi:hypothetical protein